MLLHELDWRRHDAQYERDNRRAFYPGASRVAFISCNRLSFDFRVWEIPNDDGTVVYSMVKTDRQHRFAREHIVFEVDPLIAQCMLLELLAGRIR